MFEIYIMKIDEAFYRAVAEGGSPPAHQPRVSREQLVNEFLVDARIKAAMAKGEATEDDYLRITENPDIKKQLLETEHWAHLVSEMKM